MGKTRITGLLASALLLSSLEARAEDVSHQPTRAAGWVVLGVGASAGAGSIVTGAVLAGERSSEGRSGVALLAGGATSLALSLIIGIPLVLTADEKAENRMPSEALVDALSGRVRF